jgi:hypothetical protein
MGGGAGSFAAGGGVVRYFQAHVRRFEREGVRKPESYTSVWDAVADTPERAANLRARAELMQKIASDLKQNGWRQAEAASRCGLT